MAIDWSDKAQKRAYMDQWRARNRAHVAEYTRRYLELHPDCAAWKKDYDKRYYRTVTRNSEQQMERIKQCSKAWDAAHPERLNARIVRYRKANREKLAQAAKVVYWALTEDERRALTAARADYNRQWREAHADELREYRRVYWEDNKDELRAASRANYAKDKVAYIQRARKRSGLLVGTYTTADIERMYVEQGGLCLGGCRKKLNGKYEIDHIMPLALDPTGDRLDNLQLLCRLCNRRKHAKHPDEWASQLGRLFV